MDHLVSNSQALVKINSGNCPRAGEVLFKLFISEKQTFTPLHALLDVPCSPNHELPPCMTALIVYSRPADSKIG